MDSDWDKNPIFFYKIQLKLISFSLRFVLKNLPQRVNCPFSVKLTLVTQRSNMKTHRHNVILVVYYLEQKLELYNSNNIISTS